MASEHLARTLIRRADVAHDLQELIGCGVAPAKKALGGFGVAPNRCQWLAQFVRDGEHQPDNEHGLYSDGGQHAHDLLPMIAPQIRLAKPDEAAGRQRAFGHAPSRVVVHRTRFA